MRHEFRKFETNFNDRFLVTIGSLPYVPVTRAPSVYRECRSLGEAGAARFENEAAATSSKTKRSNREKLLHA